MADPSASSGIAENSIGSREWSITLVLGLIQQGHNSCRWLGLGRRRLRSDPGHDLFG